MTMHKLALSPVLAFVFAVTHPLAAQGVERGQEPAPTESAPDFSAQEWLLARNKYGDYEKATFNFEFGLRDDPELEVTRNDWDFIFGNNAKSETDRFDVRTVRDDISLIADLGAVDFGDLDPSQAEAAVMLEQANCVLGHSYAVHTMDGESDRWSLFRVVAHKQGDSARISWISFDPQALRSSPGLTIDAKQGKKLRAFVAAIHARGGLAYCMRISEEASERTFDRISHQRVKNLPTRFGDLLDRIGELPDVSVEFAQVVPSDRTALRAAEIPFDARVRSLEDALEITTRALRLSWVVRTDGSLVIRRA